MPKNEDFLAQQELENEIFPSSNSDVEDHSGCGWEDLMRAL